MRKKANTTIRNSKFLAHFVGVSHMLALVVFTTPIFATTPTESYQSEDIQVKEFSETDWENLKQGIDYSRSRIQERKEEEERAADEMPETGETTRRRRIDSGSGGGAGQILAVIALLILLGLLTYFLFQQGLMTSTRSKKSKTSQGEGLEVSLEAVEKDLDKKDPTSLIDRAVNAADFKMAIRLYYLKIIRTLSLDGAIKWKRDKTNSSYVRELNGSPLQAGFKDITFIFEQIFYGNQNITEKDFQEIKPLMENFLQSVENQAKVK